MEATGPPSKRLRETPSSFATQQEPTVEIVAQEPVPSTITVPNNSEVPVEHDIPAQVTETLQGSSINTNMNIEEDLRELKATVASLADIVHTLLPGQIHQGNSVQNEEQGSTLMVTHNRSSGHDNEARLRSATTHMSINYHTDGQVPQDYGVQTSKNGQCLT